MFELVFPMWYMELLKLVQNPLKDLNNNKTLKAAFQGLNGNLFKSENYESVKLFGNFILFTLAQQGKRVEHVTKTN